MRTDPFADAIAWLFDFRWQTLLYLALLVASVVVASINWTHDPEQRRAESVTIWLFRLLIGAMWYQGTTWKLPLPVSDAFAYWLGETAKYAAFPFIRSLVTNVFQPLLPVVGTLIYFAELFFAVTITLGVLTRLGALLALGQATFLWIGLYQAPNEWPWNYVFLMIVHGFFIVIAAGRYLGVDAILRRPGAAADRATGLVPTLLRLAT
jgi:TQO small subunit DoxD